MSTLATIAVVGGIWIGFLTLLVVALVWATREVKAPRDELRRLLHFVEGTNPEPDEFSRAWDEIWVKS